MGRTKKQAGGSAAASSSTRAITSNVPVNFDDLWSSDGELQGQAYQHILAMTEQPVDWTYEVWNELLERLADKDNRSRSIAAQLLCNLAKSDPEQRLLQDFPKLFAVTGDERFVTARHCLQALWKVGCVGRKHRAILVAALEKWFLDCRSHKNWSLIRYDIIESLRRLFDAAQDDAVRVRAHALIELEDDSKYKKKYLSLWPKR